MGTQEKKPKQTQTSAILEHLMQYGKITSIEAFERYGATRLSAIIFRLRKNYGYTINTRMETGKNRFGETVQYGIYELIGGKQNADN